MVRLGKKKISRPDGHGLGGHVQLHRSRSIIAIATSLSLWQNEFGIDDFAVGLLAALSANAFGAAAGALIAVRCATNTVASSSTRTT